MRTLEQFVNKHGNLAKAAVAIGIAETTLWRWIKNKSKPRGLALRRVMELGISLGQTFTLDKITRVVKVRPRRMAFAKNDEEMLLGMFDMTPGERVADADQLRLSLWNLAHGSAPAPRLERVARISRRSDD